jgi:hypothetical protein
LSHSRGAHGDSLGAGRASTRASAETIVVTTTGPVVDAVAGGRGTNTSTASDLPFESLCPDGAGGHVDNNLTCRGHYGAIALPSPVESLPAAPSGLASRTKIASRVLAADSTGVNSGDSAQAARPTT